MTSSMKMVVITQSHFCAIGVHNFLNFVRLISIYATTLTIFIFTYKKKT